jgi:hypothetical protein
MKYRLITLSVCMAIFSFQSCKKEVTNDEKPIVDTTSAEPKLIFKFKFDPTQDRYDSFGNLKNNLDPGHAAQNPDFNSMVAHYIELTSNPFVQVGKGEILYHAPEVIQNGETGIDHSKSIFARDNQSFFSIPLKKIKPGEYEFLRISVAYQNYNVKLHYDTTFNTSYAGTTYTITADEIFPATIASFVGYNTYIKTFSIQDTNISVNGFRKQGFWGGRQKGNIPFRDKNTGTKVYDHAFNFTTTGQGAGATTVPNPLFATSPIPSGSCLVTGSFQGKKLTITGNETKNIVVVASFSTNKSFEWKDLNGNGLWDPTKGEYVVDMGLRGLKAYIQ